MDRFCIDRGTLLDNPSVTTLLNPEKHSLHCLVDVARCTDSGFEILAPVSKPTADAAYCPAYRIGGSSGFDDTLKLARELGNKNGSCSTCTGSTLDKGFRALFVGTVSSDAKWSGSKPPLLEVTQVLKAGSKCPNGLAQTPAPCDSAEGVTTSTTTAASTKTAAPGMYVRMYECTRSTAFGYWYFAQCVLVKMSNGHIIQFSRRSCFYYLIGQSCDITICACVRC